MKSKIIFVALVVVVVGAGVWWNVSHRTSSVPVATASAGRKILYYQSAMHPWIKSDKPGKCPICGMDLVPIYAGEGDTNADGGLTLNPTSISVIHVQTDLVERRPVRRTLHLAGAISWNSWTAAWFEFTAYERDLAWLKIGQTIEVNVPSAPGKTYTAHIKLHSVKPFADRDFDMMSGTTTVRAEISNPPIEAGDLGKNKLFNGLHAEGHLLAETEETLTVPRTAVISRGLGPMVYVDKGNGHYTPRAVKLGRVGDEFYEVLSGLNAGEKVVTTGNLLIDSEAQLTAGQ